MNRSRWRVFLTVFLVIFLGGFGISGAAALWSLKTNVTAQISTGTWFSPGFTWEPTITVIDRGTTPLGWWQNATFTWTAPQGAPGTARFYVDFTPTVSNPSVRERPANPISALTMNVQTSRPQAWSSESFRVRFQAEVDGVRSAPVCRTFTLRGNLRGGGIEELQPASCPA
jgi:hypothetical protein